MRRLLYLSLFVFACAVPAFAQDPVKVDPDHYKVAINNSQVRVLKVHYGPHEKSKMHYHPNAVAIPQTSGKVIFWLPGGKHTEVDMVAGEAMWTAAGRHNPENASDSDMDVILIELKPRKKTAPKPANTNTNPQ
jgi:quercetin dioxygenase-like cupin family protein